MAALSDILYSLDEALNSPSCKSLFTNSAPFDEFLGMLNDSRARVVALLTQGVNQLSWPFNQNENKKWLHKIEVESYFSLALNVQCPHENRQLRQDVKVVFDEIQREKRKRILEWLSPISFSTRHHELRKARTPGCGTWFLKTKEFPTWVDTHGPSNLLFSGIVWPSCIISKTVQSEQGNPFSCEFPFQYLSGVTI
jgi:hypothetical protein